MKKILTFDDNTNIAPSTADGHAAHVQSSTTSSVRQRHDDSQQQLFNRFESLYLNIVYGFFAEITKTRFVVKSWIYIMVFFLSRIYLYY